LIFALLFVRIKDIPKIKKKPIIFAHHIMAISKFEYYSLTLGNSWKTVQVSLLGKFALTKEISLELKLINETIFFIHLFSFSLF